MLKIYHIPISYIITAPAFIIMLLIFFWYCYLSVRECRRSRGREYEPLLAQVREAQLQVY